MVRLFLLIPMLLTTLACGSETGELRLIGPARNGRDYAPPPLRDLKRANKIKVIYFVPSDREPARNYQQKIEVMLAFVADVYRRDLQAKGQRCAGLDFEFAGERLKVNLIRGKEAAAHYTLAPKYDGLHTWRTVLREVEPQMGRAGDQLPLILTETYDEGPWRYEWPGTFALGAHYSARGGAAMFCGWNLKDEFSATTIADQLKLLADATPIEGRTALGHGRPNSPHYEFIEDAIGAVVHEMGHVLGLPHDHRRDESFIMGNGFRSLRVNYIGQAMNRPVMCFSENDANVLAYSRFLCDGVNRNDNTPPTVKLDMPEVFKAGATQIRVRGVAADDVALGAVTYYLSQGDSVRGGAKLSGRSTKLDTALSVAPLVAGEAHLDVIVIDRGGNIAKAVQKFRIE